MSDLRPDSPAALAEPFAAAACADEAAPPRPRVLVVDDEELVGTMLNVMLQHRGCSVLLARSGAEALAKYRQGPPVALVIMDVRMPGMDGPETLQALRAVDPNVTCCFMTGDTGRYTEEELLALGAKRLLKKPFHLDEVEQVLQRYVFAPTAA